MIGAEQGSRQIDTRFTDEPQAASLLIARDGLFLTAARPPKVTHDRTLVALTGVGGWLEPGESLAEAVQRESLEETGQEIRLFDLHRTLIVRSPESIEPVCLIGQIGPVAIVHSRIGTPPFSPWSEEFESVVSVSVYAGQLEGPPRIVAPEEHPFFLWLYPEQLIDLSDAELPLTYLLDDGALLEGVFDADDGRALVRMTDSISSLVRALGREAFRFLGDIARLTQPARAE